MSKSSEYLETRDFKNVKLKNQDLELDPSVTWLLGSNAQFDGCRFHCKVKSSQLIVSTSTLRNCEFNAKIRLTNQDWSPAKLINCVFTGIYSGCDFGPRPKLGLNESHGDVVNCDYSGAVLDLCRFFNVDVGSIVFPNWPSFTIVDSTAAAKDFRKGSLSDDAVEYASDTLEDVSPGEVALSLLATKEVKRLKCTLNDLKQFLTGKEYAVW